MSDPVIFQIEQGTLAFALVDTTAVGYLDSWLAPAGKTVDTVTLADYNAASASWTCQTTSGALQATPDTTTVDVAATFCAPASTRPQPKQTAYALALSFLQDPNVKMGLSRFLFENDTKDAFVFFGMNGMDPPKMIGRVKLAAGTIGGAARTTLTADLTLPLSGKPQVEFGTATDHDIVPPNPVPPAGVTAGTPGSFTPAGATAPANLAALKADPVVGDAGTAKPTSTPWTTGQYIVLGDASNAHWSGTAWVTGKA